MSLLICEAGGREAEPRDRVTAVPSVGTADGTHTRAGGGARAARAAALSPSA